MKQLKLDPHTPAPLFLEMAAEVIYHDGLVAYPTETVYGLGANALSHTAVAKVNAVKARENKPMSIACHSVNQAQNYVKWNEEAETLANTFLPGPLTLVLPAKATLPAPLRSDTNAVGIRIPDLPLVTQLVERCQCPITATSANISGESAAKTVKEAQEQLGEELDLYLDTGPCDMTIPSTVADISQKKIAVLREGPITQEEILEAVDASQSQ